ncbi:hypothetical protein IQ215_02660 [Cyanobacterium stanieri LEGE 03274]|uniref:Uncharacterized protein n=1 Tax=Cyanobacterium stanieri LEGE 03274 TaxID=1828756 RepID=A0ABR9V211_9CHRO|nr:hypothetical protein [Cyanobacterium stanieri]MBE9221589.1 hypothetical protein [Cyanobacterium stanieri LEGE 03274]
MKNYSLYYFYKEQELLKPLVDKVFVNYVIVELEEDKKRITMIRNLKQLVSETNAKETYLRYFYKRIINFYKASFLDYLHDIFIFDSVYKDEFEQEILPTLKLLQNNYQWLNSLYKQDKYSLCWLDWKKNCKIPKTKRYEVIKTYKDFYNKYILDLFLRGLEVKEQLFFDVLEPNVINEKKLLEKIYQL